METKIKKLLKKYRAELRKLHYPDTYSIHPFITLEASAKIEILINVISELEDVLK